jgi:hypothetical protein
MRQVLVTLAVAVVLAGSLFFAVEGISTQVNSEATSFLEDAVRRSAVQCYALEGRFPQDLQHLEDNSGLIVDHDRYAVYYESMGDNLIPQIRVIVLP